MQSFSSGGVRVSTGWLDFSEEQYELAESVRLLRLAETSESGVQGDVRTPMGGRGLFNFVFLRRARTVLERQAVTLR